MGDKLIDLTSQKFGRLTVIKRSYPNGNRRQPKWLCKCDCGKEKVILGDSLKQGVIKSCGCLKADNHLEPGLANMRKLISDYKQKAKKHRLNYKLTEEQFKEITQKDCYYCGAKPNNVTRSPTYNGDYIYNGLDRIDNAKGYTMENVVSCCKTCNSAKGILTIQEFKDWLERAYNKIFKKGDD